MDIEITTQVLLWAFGLAIVFGIVTSKTHFCTMGAVSDIVNIGNTGRMRAWVFAMGVAILGVLALGQLGMLDISLTADNDTANPPYRTPMMAWPRYLLGGLLFGIGMTLASGCSGKTLLRMGSGNLKAWVTFIVMGFVAYAMIFTNFAENAFIGWMRPAFIDLTNYDIESQSISDIVGGVIGSGSANLALGITAAIGGVLVLWALLSKDFLTSVDNVLSGLVVGGIIVAAWWVTTGSIGEAWVEEVDFMEEPPFGVGAQAFTFVQPSAHLLRWFETGFSSIMVTFTLVSAFGVMLGSFVYSLLTGKLVLEWFRNWRDAVAHVIGGALMGLGGVLAMGCTTGQAISGVSTLALGSFLACGAIMLGSALTMKVQYYGMVYEDETNVWKSLLTSLVDLRLLPSGMRKLDKV